MPSFYGLIEVIILLLNALAILNENFLKSMGLGPSQIQGEENFKSQISRLLSSVSYLCRVPLIPVNLGSIVLLLFFG